MTENEITQVMFFAETLGHDCCQHVARQVLHSWKLLQQDPTREDAKKLIDAFLRFLLDESYIPDDVLFAIGFRPTDEEFEAQARREAATHAS